MILKKFKSSFLFILGFLLSPLCWWNDLIFNLPLAYAFGKIVAFIAPNLLLPACIVGYWLSNIIGVILMQFGTLSFLDQPSEKPTLKKNLIIGFVSSTVFTLIAVVLWQNNLLDFSISPFLADTKSL